MPTDPNAPVDPAVMLAEVRKCIPGLHKKHRYRYTALVVTRLCDAFDAYLNPVAAPPPVVSESKVAAKTRKKKPADA